jgi:TPP-dependent 2-oxoacid decarboxylase
MPKSTSMPSRPGEFHPEPLTEPDLTLSRHPARATARRLPPSTETKDRAITADRRLVAQCESRKNVAFFDNLEQRQHEIAGNTKNLVGAVVEDADPVLMLGVILSDTNFALSNRAPDPRRTILASSREVQIGYHCFRDMPLADLIEALGAHAKPSGPRPHLMKQHSVYPHGLPADEAPISPSDVATAINDLFDRYGKMPMTSDIGDCLFTAMEIDNTALAAPGYYAGMGFGVPAGIGVAATGLRPLILVGDGAFQMTGWELGNCGRYGLDPIVVLFNNGSWEMLRVFQPESGFKSVRERMAKA